MDKIHLLAEKILINAARSSDGNCYPSQIVESFNETEEALKLIEIYGTAHPLSRGANPVFSINDLGKHFVSTGAWSGEIRRERIEEERYNNSISLAKKNNKYQMVAIITAIIVGILSIIVSVLLYKGVI